MLAQTNYHIDSLKIKLETASDTQQVDILIQLADTLSHTDLSESLLYANKVLELSVANNYQKSEARANSILGYINAKQKHFDNAIKYYTTSLDLYQKLNLAESELKTLHSLSVVYYFINDFRKAVDIANEGATVENKDDYPLMLAKLYSMSGLSYFKLSMLDSALQYYNRAKSIYLSHQDQKQYAKVCNRLGALYNSYGEYDKSIANYLELLTIARELNDSVLMSLATTNLGGIYYNINNDQQALRYSQEALRINYRLKDFEGVAELLNNLGAIYNSNNINDSALIFFTKALAIADSLNVGFTKSNIELNLGKLYIDEGKYELGLENAISAYNFKKDVGNKEGMMIASNIIGDIYCETEKYNEAEKYYQDALTLAMETHIKKRTKLIYRSLSELSSKQGKPAKALEYYKLYKAYNDSLFNETKSEQIAEMQTKYETEKQIKENTILRQENDINKLNIQSKNRTILHLSVGMVLFTLLFGIIILLYIKSKKAFNDLVKQNIIIAKAEYGLFSSKDTDSDVENRMEGKTDLATKLEKFMIVEKPFLYSGITLEEISQKMGINRTYLSNTINEHFGKNFNELINDYRIKVARQLLTDPSKDHFSIEGIGQMAGFNSKSTFYSCFKKSTGITPSYFRKSVRDL